MLENGVFFVYHFVSGQWSLGRFERCVYQRIIGSIVLLLRAEVEGEVYGFYTCLYSFEWKLWKS